MRSTVVETKAPGLPWRRIGVFGVVFGVAGIGTVVTTSGLDTGAVLIASLLDVAAGMAIIGGLWAATFFSPEEH